MNISSMCMHLNFKSDVSACQLATRGRAEWATVWVGTTGKIDTREGGIVPDVRKWRTIRAPALDEKRRREGKTRGAPDTQY